MAACRRLTYSERAVARFRNRHALPRQRNFIGLRRSIPVRLALARLACNAERTAFVSDPGGDQKHRPEPPACPILPLMVPSPGHAVAVSPLIQTKLFVPRTRPGLVPRPRPIERLNRGAEGKRTFVSAAAGFVPRSSRALLDLLHLGGAVGACPCRHTRTLAAAFAPASASRDAAADSAQ
jgi:hypothetical protein